jgi:ABC-type sugar transport system substrate-binding protein
MLISRMKSATLVVAVIAIVGSLAACSSSKSGTSSSSGGASFGSAIQSSDTTEINATIETAYGPNVSQTDIPQVVLEALKVAAVPADQTLINKLKSCLGKTKCDTGHGSITIGIPIDDRNSFTSFEANSLLQALRYPAVKTILMPDGQSDLQRIISNFRSLVSQKVNLIVMNSGYGASLGPVARQAMKQGIVVAAASQGIAGIAPGKNYIFIGNNLCDYGKAQATAVFAGSGKSTGGSVAMLTGIPGNPYAAGWQPCAKQAFSAAKWSVANSLTTNWTPQGEAQAASTMLASGKRVDAIAYDGNCVGLVKSYLDAGKTPPTIAAAGVQPECVSLWQHAQSGSHKFNAYTGNSQVWVMDIGVTAGLNRLAGQDVPSSIDLTLPLISFGSLVKRNPGYASLPPSASFQSLLPAEITKTVLGG